MSIPLLLGTMVTPHRDRAMLLGSLLMAMLPGLHPRMKSEQAGGGSAAHPQPPGFLALNYGERTPLVTLAARLVYGALLGAFCHLS